VAWGLLIATASPVLAQQSLSDVLSFLLTNQAVSTGDFMRDAEATRATRDTFTQLVLSEVTTLPLSSSSAGFAYRFNPGLGIEERVSDSFGSFFTERATTAGRGQASFGVNVRVASFSELDGVNLRDGHFVTTANQFKDESAPFDVETLTLELESRTLTFVGNVGVTDRLDVGVAVPLVSLSLDGERINTYRSQEGVQAEAHARVSGLGDIALRAKYALWERTGSGVAVLGDFRMPTGRAEDLLGTGEPALRTLVVGSLEHEAIGVHGNGSFTIGGPSSELGYRSAVTFSASPVVTIVGELVGRHLTNGGQFAIARAPHPTLRDVETIRLVPEEGGTSTAAGVFGVKWNVARTWLVEGHVWRPLTHGGLRSTTMVVVGVEYAITP